MTSINRVTGTSKLRRLRLALALSLSFSAPPLTAFAQGFEFDVVQTPNIAEERVFGPFSQAQVESLRTEAFRRAAGGDGQKFLSVAKPQPTGPDNLPEGSWHKTIVDGSTGAALRSSMGFVSRVVVEEPGAPWIKLAFRRFDLGDVVIQIYGEGSSSRQRLDRRSLVDWSWHSRVFRTDKVILEAFVEPDGEVPVGFTLRNAISGVLRGRSLTTPVPHPDQRQGASEESLTDLREESGQCAEDGRALTDDPRVARIFPEGCTAFALGDGVFASAGHCFRKNRHLQELEFNVGPSTPRGGLAEAAEENVYPIDQESLICRDCTVINSARGSARRGNPDGDDWALFRIHPNSTTGLTFEEATRTQMFAMPTDVSASSQEAAPNIFAMGYGYDKDPMEANGALQAGAGEHAGLAFNPAEGVYAVRHTADTHIGSSGSPILFRVPETGQLMVIGIHNAGLCGPRNDRPNAGTSIFHPGLQAAYQQMRGAAQQLQ